ncbi:hypothetical protein [Nocardia veterana]|uniref:Uncharacterized protein n=1 Tax=Nocardia veterana TaxID=132249 RepID=A0A7X6M3G3_9NOCA|nr:hypothetical protein [Nocardia veterana]NKY89643.1 hypothetical protein [Nocardia veterana]
MSTVDRVLTDYPMIVLRVVRIADLGDDPAKVRWSARTDDDPDVDAGPSITLDQGAASAPDHAGEPQGTRVRSATLREFGRALNAAGGSVASKTAQKVLIGEFLRSESWRLRSLGEVVRGYRQWRAELTGGPADAPFDAEQALGAAFADVVLHGNAAGAQAKALHAVLVGACSSRV